MYLVYLTAEPEYSKYSKYSNYTLLIVVYRIFG